MIGVGIKIALNCYVHIAIVSTNFKKDLLMGMYGFWLDEEQHILQYTTLNTPATIV